MPMYDTKQLRIQFLAQCHRLIPILTNEFESYTKTCYPGDRTYGAEACNRFCVLLYQTRLPMC
jgi:hypothetical protein